MAASFRSLASIGKRDEGKEASLGGWVEDVRNLGGIAFLLVGDRDGTFQVTVKKAADEALFDRASRVVRESVILVRGMVQPNPKVRNGWELVASSLDNLSPASAPLPLPIADKVSAEIDTRFDNRVLDLRKPERRAIFRVRSIVARALRSFLDGQGFVEVQTPKLAGAGAEGGATLFRTDYFGRPAYLSQSPQLYKQILMATGLDRVYEIAPAFRAEPSDTVRHVTEFTSFDGEVAWIERQEDVLRFLEGAVDHAIEAAKASAPAAAVPGSARNPPGQGKARARWRRHRHGGREDARARARRTRPRSVLHHRVSERHQAVLRYDEGGRAGVLGVLRPRIQGGRDGFRRTEGAPPRPARHADEGEGIEPGELRVLPEGVPLRDAAARRMGLRPRPVRPEAARPPEHP